MTGTRQPPGLPAAADVPRRSSAMLATAWISLGVLAVALPFGRWVSIAFLDAFGYDAVDEVEPPGLGLLAFLAGVAVVLAPAALALWSGRRAWHAGRGSALVVVVVAGLVIALVLLGLPLYLSRLVGWPLVLAIGAGLAAICWFARPRGWGPASQAPTR